MNLIAAVVQYAYHWCKSKMSGKLRCRSCRREFKHLAHLRSHQSRNLNCTVATSNTVGQAEFISDPQPSEHARQPNIYRTVPSVHTMSDQYGVLTDNEPNLSLYVEEVCRPSAVQGRSNPGDVLIERFGERRRVAEDVFLFFDSLGSEVEELQKHKLVTTVDESSFPRPVSAFIELCTSGLKTQCDIQTLYAFMESYEKSLPQSLRPISAHIKSSRHLSKIIESRAKAAIGNEGWRRVGIDVNHFLDKKNIIFLSMTQGSFDVQCHYC